MKTSDLTAAFTVRLTPDEHNDLRELAAREHRSVAAQARKAIVEEIARTSDKAAA